MTVLAVLESACPFLFVTKRQPFLPVSAVMAVVTAPWEMG